MWEKLCELESINKEIRQTTAPVTSDSESEPNQNARLAEVREPNEDADPIETPIEVQAWALAQELIRAKRKLIHASCEKSYTLESTYAKMCGAPQSQVDPVSFEIEKEKQVRKTTFDAIASVSRQMTSFEDTYPLVREKRRLEHGYGTALALDKDEKKQNRLLWQKLGKLESQNTAITRTTASSNSQTLRIGD
ncbi:hypothetical protein QRQ56_39065 [Bradyrhizobium sp. U531]|uniref:hypothetical protein n=1 Tax=Bradyrhizobium sp. U531 TaxID=3053458 RepID=UPI003F41B616